MTTPVPPSSLSCWYQGQIRSPEEGRGRTDVHACARQQGWHRSCFTDAQGSCFEVGKLGKGMAVQIAPHFFLLPEACLKFKSSGDRGSDRGTTHATTRVHEAFS